VTPQHSEVIGQGSASSILIARCFKVNSGSRATITLLLELFASISHTAICPTLPPGFSFRMCFAWCYGQ
jgi:hypothetical protein